LPWTATTSSHSPATTGAATERMNFQRRNQCGSLKYDSPIRLARIFVDCWRDAIVASVPERDHGVHRTQQQQRQ
jgi:hypothetical protein